MKHLFVVLNLLLGSANLGLCVSSMIDGIANASGMHAAIAAICFSVSWYTTKI